MYILYLTGHFLAVSLPLKVSYTIASIVADLYYYLSSRDRNAVINNLRIITGGNSDEASLRKMAKEVFRNFAKYLVDFFRFSKINENYICKFVKIEGLDNIKYALARGKGVIVLSAHIGNWELGGSVMSLSGYPLSAVALTHQDKKVNEFFTKQRLMGRVRPIKIGISLRSCYEILRGNGLLALLGDRDFTKNGIRVKFFGKKICIPRGPSAFSSKIGSAIVPSFMVREPDDTFRLCIEKPIFPSGNNGGEELLAMAEKYVPILESYIRKYPTQWFMFKDMWSNNNENMRPDTVL